MLIGARPDGDVLQKCTRSESNPVRPPLRTAIRLVVIPFALLALFFAGWLGYIMDGPQDLAIANGYDRSLFHLGRRNLTGFRRSFQSGAFSAGAVLSNSRDMAVFVHALFAGRILGEPTLGRCARCGCALAKRLWTGVESAYAPGGRVHGPYRDDPWLNGPGYALYRPGLYPGRTEQSIHHRPDAPVGGIQRGNPGR